MEIHPRLFQKLKFITLLAVFGTLAGLMFAYLNYNIYEDIQLVSVLFRGAEIGLAIGICVGIIEEYILSPLLKIKSYLVINFYRLVFFSFTFIFWLIVINSINDCLRKDVSFFYAAKDYIFNRTFLSDFIFALVTSFIIISFLMITKLHRKGDLLKYVTGRYHQPQEVERIFLFIDLKSSTAIAERLGNIQYSKFLKDFFYDLSEAILLSKGEVYQYVGDEIVVTWPFSRGIKYSRCIYCFYDMKNSIELLKNEYLEKYGTYPEFKAGIHGGKVVVTWIGDLKKEIVYHGDVLNTASRILESCNYLKEEFLISEEFLSSIELPEYLKATFRCELQLRGKKNKVKVYGLKRIP
jgi:adenylate cyclase